MASVSSGPSNYRTLRAQPASGSGQSRLSLSLFTQRREKWHPEKLGMANANIDKAWLLWGCLWRASLYELLLGAAFAGFYGAVFGTLAFPVVGTLIGFVFGAPAGALVGLPLGLIDGLLLMIWLTVSTHEDEILNPHRYRLRAGAVCAVGSLIALLGDWALHGLSDSNYFATSRTACLSVYLIDPPCALDEGMPIAMDLTILVIVPLTMAVLASRFTGRIVAGWYAGVVSET